MSTLKQYLIAAAVFSVIFALILFVWWHAEQISALETTNFNAGKAQCETAVNEATTKVLRDADVKRQERERKFNADLFEAREAQKAAEQRILDLKSVAKGQHLELNAQAADLQCVIPDATIDTLNRPIKLAPAAPPPAPTPTPKKAAVAPAAPVKSTDLPSFLQAK
jgi:hypothetical protein